MNSKSLSVAEGRGSSQMRSVGSHYGTVGERITQLPPLEVDRYYYPLADRSVLKDLSNVPDGDEPSALGFVRKWGFLGPLPERWLDLWRRGEPLPGDTLVYLWQHARQVRLVLRLARCIEQQDDARLEMLLSETFQPGKIDAPEKEQIFDIIDVDGEVSSANRRKWQLLESNETGGFRTVVTSQVDEDRLVAHDIVVRILDANLGSVRLGVKQSTHGQSPGLNLVRSSKFDSLAAAIYLLLTEVVEARRRFLECAYPRCGKLFEQTHGRQRYCPSEDSTQGESLCSIRHRQQTYREKHRGGRSSA